MMNEHEKREACDYALAAVIGGLLILILAVMLGGCSSVRYVPIENKQADTIISERVDTVYLSSRIISESEKTSAESIKETVSENTVIVVNLQGDTLRTDRVKEIIKDHTLKEENSLLLAELDSLREVNKHISEQKHIEYVDRPYPIEKTLSRWQQIKMDFGGLAMGGTLVAIIFVIIWLVKKFR